MHVEVCPITVTFRLLQCQYCNDYSASEQDLFEKHQLVCPKFPISCPNKCGASIQRKNVTKHVDTTCPLSKLQCEYSHVGCTVGALTRKEMDIHLKSVVGMKTHLSLMDIAYSDLKRRESQIKREEDKLVRKVNGLENQLEVLKSKECHARQLAEFNLHKKEALEKEIRHQKTVIDKLEAENRRLKNNQVTRQTASASAISVKVVNPATTRPHCRKPPPPTKPSGGHKASADKVTITTSRPKSSGRKTSADKVATRSSGGRKTAPDSTKQECVVRVKTTTTVVSHIQQPRNMRGSTRPVKK